MTPEQVALVVQSVDELRPRMPEVAADFYRRLFDIAPEVRQLFHHDLASQTVKFARELDEIVAVIPSFGEFEGRTAALGRHHAGYGVRASHYELVKEALVAALGDALGESFTDATREARDNAFCLVAESMQLGAAAQHRGSPTLLVAAGKSHAKLSSHCSFAGSSTARIWRCAAKGRALSAQNGIPK